MRDALPARYRERVVRPDLLPLQLIEARLPEMIPQYVRHAGVVHDIISTAFSSR